MGRKALELAKKLKQPAKVTADKSIEIKNSAAVAAKGTSQSAILQPAQRGNVDDATTSNIGTEKRPDTEGTPVTLEATEKLEGAADKPDANKNPVPPPVNLKTAPQRQNEPTNRATSLVKKVKKALVGER